MKGALGIISQLWKVPSDLTHLQKNYYVGAFKWTATIYRIGQRVAQGDRSTQSEACWKALQKAKRWKVKE